MNFSMTFKNVESHVGVEPLAVPHVAKLDRLLKSYSPDLVQLHAVLAKQPRKEEYTLTLNLKLPTGAMHCVGSGSDVRACMKQAFVELESQVKKHKHHVRHDYEWKRKRPRTAALA